MDPTTTLISFMLQTEPSVGFVHLIGSWDNFSRSYFLERDTRRGPGQWKGCYCFENITCDGDNGRSRSSRNGGLKMGSQYYYYYELDGSKEVHDPTMPSTNCCPYLPGQTLNTLAVPEERSHRQRSSSLNAIRFGDFRTMNPNDRFVCPRPAPQLPRSLPERARSAPSVSGSCSLRTVSPAPSWRRFLGFKSGSHSSNESRPVTPASCNDDCLRAPRLSTTSQEASFSRDASPVTLRRFPVDAEPASRPHSRRDEKPKLVIPAGICEEHDDDDNFASSAISEHLMFRTGLSPPPLRRIDSSDTVAMKLGNDSSRTLTLALHKATRESPLVNELGDFPLPPLGTPRLSSHLSTSTMTSSSVSLAASPMSPRSPDLGPRSFLHDDEEGNSTDGSNTFTFRPMLLGGPSAHTAGLGPPAEFAGYRLPDTVASKGHSSQAPFEFGFPTQMEPDIAGHGSPFIDMPSLSDVDSLIEELGWMLGTTIGGKSG